MIDPGVYIAVSSAMLSGAAIISPMISRARQGMIDLLREKVDDCERRHKLCEDEIAALRSELAWMRQHMMMKSGGVA